MVGCSSESHEVLSKVVGKGRKICLISLSLGDVEVALMKSHGLAHGVEYLRIDTDKIKYVKDEGGNVSKITYENGEIDADLVI